ncbi:13053_t:CDS:2, partial [Acaulospora morrowiae]
MSSTTSPSEYKSSANHSTTTTTTTTAWGEGMVTSDLRTDTGISQLLEGSPLIYTPTLSSTGTSPELRDTLETDDDGLFLGDYISIEELRKIASDNECILSATTNNSPTLPIMTPITPMKPIAPALFSPISAISSGVISDSQDKSTSPAPVASEEKKKSAGGRKRKAESLEEKEQRQRESHDLTVTIVFLRRILRNRHAAQMSRDKKRRQMADLESQNVVLKEENAHLSKRLKVVEEENAILSNRLETISAQLAEIQSHLAVSEMTKVLLDGVRGSAVSAASEGDSLMITDEKEENQKEEKNSPDNEQPSSITTIRETSEKSQQRHVKMRNLYGTSLTPTFPIWMYPPQMLKQLLLTFSI